MIILGCDWSTVRHVSVRIFSTLILLALDRFGEPIRMKHSRCKQHTGEGEEKDIDCSDQYSEVLRTHTHCICLHETSVWVHRYFNTSGPVRGAPRWTESLNASQPAQRRFFHSTSMNFKVALANIHLIKLAQFLHVSHKKNDFSFFLFLSFTPQNDAQRAAEHQETTRPSPWSGNRPRDREKERRRALFYAWPLRARSLRMASTSHLWTTQVQAGSS